MTAAEPSAIAAEIILQLSAQPPLRTPRRFLIDAERLAWTRVALLGRRRSMDVTYQGGRDLDDVAVHDLPADPRAEVHTRHVGGVYCDQLGPLLASPPPGTTHPLFQPRPFEPVVRVTDSTRSSAPTIRPRWRWPRSTPLARGSARYRFYERGTSAPGMMPEAALAALPAAVGLLHVGTLGLTLEPVATALEAVVERLADRALVVVDPNCRPWVIADAAAYRRGLKRVLGRSRLVKVSEEDLAFPDPDREPAEAARALLDLGPTAALLTLGRDGAPVVSAGAETQVPRAGRAGRRHDRRRRRVRRRLRHLVALVRPGPRRPRRPRRGRRGRALACLVAARTCERPGASPPRLEELQTDA